METSPKLISRMDTDYKTKTDSYQTSHVNREQPFGIGWMGYIVSLPEKSNQIRALNLLANDTRKRIQEIGLTDNGVGLIEDMLSQAVKEPRLSDRIRLLFDQYEGKNLSLSDFFSQSVVPNPLLLEILQSHQEYLLSLQENIEPRFAEFKADYQNRLMNEIQRGKFDLDTSVIEDRLSKVKPVVADFLNHPQPDNSHAKYRATTQVVRFSPQYISDSFEELAGHEISHVASGATIFNRRQSKMRQPERDLYRSGVRTYHSAGVPTSPASQRFLWLNEALTENLHLYLYPEHANTIYYEEDRILLNVLLRASGQRLPVAPFYQAYFEDYSDAQQGMPGWQRMMENVNNAYSPGFLTKLDTYIRKSGKSLAEVTAVLKDDWRQIAEWQG